MNTHILCFPCMAISTDDTLHRIRSLDSICNRHPMYFHFWNSPYQCDVLVLYSLAYSLAYWLSLSCMYVCMYVCNAMHVSVQIQQPTIECLLWMLDIFTSSAIRPFWFCVLIIRLWLCSLLVTHMHKTQSHTHIYVYIHTHKWSKANEIHKKAHSSLASKTRCSALFVFVVFTTKYLCMKFCWAKNFSNTLLV